MKCFAFISCWKKWIHCKRKFKREHTRLGYDHLCRLAAYENFWSKLEKSTLYIKSKDAEVGICWVPQHPSGISWLRCAFLRGKLCYGTEHPPRMGIKIQDMANSAPSLWFMPKDLNLNWDLNSPFPFIGILWGANASGLFFHILDFPHHWWI